MKARILVIEDEMAINDLLCMNLEAAGYETVGYLDGNDASEGVAQDHEFQCALVDIMLPGINGYELLDYIRPMEIPVIFLTAKTQVNDIVKGLRSGAEDYVSKPFEIPELLARVETVLRRFHKNDSRLVSGEVQVDLQSHTVTREGKMVSLTSKEYELLVLFIRNKNIALFRDRIYESVWKEEYSGNSRTVDLHVQRLRKKLGWEEKIQAVYKIGYRLEEKE